MIWRAIGGGRLDLASARKSVNDESHAGQMDLSQIGSLFSVVSLNLCFRKYPAHTVCSFALAPLLCRESINGICDYIILKL